MEHKPDFYLSAAGESEKLANPRACWTKDRLSDSLRNDYMLIEVKPSLIGQPYGLGNKDIDNLIISTRHKGFSLFPITEWPCYVYIARILDESIIKRLVFTGDQAELLAWGMIFQTLDEAKTHAKKYGRYQE